MQPKIAAVLMAVVLAGSAGGAAASPRIVTDLSAFRSGPGMNFLPMMAIPPQTVVDVRGCCNGWCRVHYAGASGFVASGLLARPVVVETGVGDPLLVEPVAVAPVLAEPVVIGAAVAPVIAAPAPMAPAPLVVAPLAPLPPPPIGLITVPLPGAYW